MSSHKSKSASITELKPSPNNTLVDLISQCAQLYSCMILVFLKRTCDKIKISDYSNLKLVLTSSIRSKGMAAWITV